MRSVKIVTSPVYLDTSALAKIYIPEPDSADVDSAMQGRRDLLVSDLAVTEMVSAIVRRIRAGDLPSGSAQRIHMKIMSQIEEGIYQMLPLSRETHREAERLLLALTSGPVLRAGDALHLALAVQGGARILFTFDNRMADAARLVGGLEVWPKRKMLAH